MRVFRMVFVVACVLSVALVAGAGAAKHKPPATGEYEADLEIHGSYSLGGWVVTKDGGKRTMVADPQYGGIYYPDPGKCDHYSLPITATSVPISKSGKFHVKEADPVGGTDVVVKVDWKGKWKSATKVTGTIKLASGNCKSANEYVAAKIPGT